MRQIPLELYLKLGEAIDYKKENPDTSLTKLEAMFGVSRKSRLLKDEEDYNTYRYHYDERVYSLEQFEIEASNEFSNTAQTTKRSIIDKYGIGKTETLDKILKVRGLSSVPKHKKIYNRDLFRTIETEEDAYWLGFVTADGYVMETRGWLSIKLGEIDRNHLFKFMKYAGFNESIIDGEIKVEKKEPRDVVNIKLYEPEIVKNLVSHGLRQGKSTKEIFTTTVPQNLIRHYIRGIFDGDGGFTNNSRLEKIDRMQIVGSKELLEGIRNEILNSGIELNNEVNLKSGNLYSLFISSQANVLSVSKYLYGDATVYLDRKYLQYESVIEKTEDSRE